MLSSACRGHIVWRIVGAQENPLRSLFGRGKKRIERRKFCAKQEGEVRSSECRGHIVWRIVGAQENPLRSLLDANEEGIYRSATP